MNITATGMFLGLVTGILGVWLFLWMSDRQHTDYRVAESSANCNIARFAVENGNHFGKASQVLLDREKNACAEEDRQVAARVTSEIKAKKEGEMMKKSIEKALSTDQVQTEKEKAEAVAAAEKAKAAVKETVKELVK